MKFDEILTQIGEFGIYQKKNYVLLMIGWIMTGPFMGLSVFINGIPDHRFDDVLVSIGEFGLFQKRNFLLLMLAYFMSAAFMRLSVFIHATPEHRCRIPGYKNDTYEVQSTTHQLLIAEYIPFSEHNTNNYDKCHVYQIDQSKTMFDNNSHPINASITKCTSWVYSRKFFDYTFVMKENLVCDNKYKVSLSKTIFFGGVLTGSFMFGVISDTFGRKRALLLGVICMFTSALSLAWSVNYTMFVVLRFCTGVCVVGMFMTVYVIGMEWVGPSRRTFVGLVIALLGPIGSMLYILESYYLRTWNWIIIIQAVPVGFYLIIWWFLPESPRWLCGKGRLEEAKQLLKKAASVNNKEFSEKMVDYLSPETKEAGKVWLLFSNRTLGIRTVVIFYNWLVASMVFYGLSLNTGMLYGDYYINFLLSVLMEFPGHLLPLFMIDRIGRKKSHMIYMSIGGLSCLSTIFTVNYGGDELQPITTALAMIGKLFSTAAFATIYVLSAEIFPTAIRNAGMGSSSAWARVGGMISPFIADTADIIGGKTGTAVPLVIFGGACLLAALLTIILPETLNCHLPESIEDGKNYGKQNKVTKHPQQVIMDNKDLSNSVKTKQINETD